MLHLAFKGVRQFSIYLITRTGQWSLGRGGGGESVRGRLADRLCEIEFMHLWCNITVS